MTAVSARDPRLQESLDGPPPSLQQSGLTERGTLDLCFVPCGSRGGAPWYCLQTHHGAELEAEWHLRNQGFAAYLPQFETIRPNRQTRIAPLFPCYLFAQVTERAPSWGPMRSTRGVASVLLMPGTMEPAQVGDAVMSALWRQCAPNGVIYPRDKAQARKTQPSILGAMVEVEAGAFTRFMGICKQEAGDRVAILLSIFGRETTVWLPREGVRRAG
jgi:transcriptional antiterminator RfaH